MIEKNWKISVVKGNDKRISHVIFWGTLFVSLLLQQIHSTFNVFNHCTQFIKNIFLFKFLDNGIHDPWEYNWDLLLLNDHRIVGLCRFEWIWKIRKTRENCLENFRNTHSAFQIFHLLDWLENLFIQLRRFKIYSIQCGTECSMFKNYFMYEIILSGFL